MSIHPDVLDYTAFKHAVSHETGHTFGLGECPGCPAGSTAMTSATSMNDTTSGHDGPTPCDSAKVQEVNQYGGGGGGGGDEGGGGGGGGGVCDPGIIGLCGQSGGIYDFGTCMCLPPDEEEGIVIVDTDGNGIELTDIADGVDFDLNGDGRIGRVSWTRRGSDDAILVIDHNKNGEFDGVWELAGHGLAIRKKKVVNPDFLLWRDINHNGSVEAGELQAMPVSGINPAFKWREYRYSDGQGNLFLRHTSIENGKSMWRVTLSKESE